MESLTRIRSDIANAINSYPQIEADIVEAFEAMIAEIESGESEDNEVEHFYSNLSQLIESAVQEHVVGKAVKEHK